MAKEHRVVISLHGIRTRGVWQKDLVPALARAGFVPYVLDYGNFGAAQLLNPFSLDKKVEWLVKEYDKIKAATRCERPSIIAHSFGTLQAAHLLRMHQHVVFDSVIFAAAIVPLDFQWSEMLMTKRVGWVENHYGGKDWWPRVARVFVPHAGASGSRPFTDRHTALYQVLNKHHGHSDYFSDGNFRDSWVPTLLLDKRRIIDVMGSVIAHLSASLGVGAARLRAFVWARARNAKHLTIVPGLRIGELAPGEDKAAISLDNPLSSALAGPAYAYNERRVSLQDQKALAGLIGKPSDPIQVHAELKWSVSLPLPTGSKEGGTAGVLVVDGLDLPTNGLAMRQFSDQDMINAVLYIGRLLHDGRKDLEE